MNAQVKRIDTQDPPPSLKTIAIIPAGGAGRRMQGSVSKQYLLLGTLPIYVHTLARFQKSEAIDAIYLVVPPEDVDDVQASVVQRYGFTKIVKVLPGGKERQDSVGNGIDALDDDVDVIVIHDAVRPFISDALIRQAALEAAASGAAVVAVPVKDTVKICDEENRITQTPDRNRIWLAQTPQAFRREILVEAYETARKDAFYATDDACLVERIGVGVRVIPGTYDNIKITTPEDLIMAEALLKKEVWAL